MGHCDFPVTNFREDRAAYNEARGWLTPGQADRWREGLLSRNPTDMQPTMDCPEALENLQWIQGPRDGRVRCNPDEDLWVYNLPKKRKNIEPEKVKCPEDGVFQVPCGAGVAAEMGSVARPICGDDIESVYKARIKRRSELSSTYNAPNIISYHVDTVSRVAFQEFLPLTTEWLRSLSNATSGQFRAFEFPRFHSVGGGTIRNTVPAHTGVLLSDILASKPMWEEWIDVDLKALGYMTTFADAWCAKALTWPKFKPAGNSNHPAHYWTKRLYDIPFPSHMMCSGDANELPRVCARTPGGECAPNTEGKSLGHLACTSGRSTNSQAVQFTKDVHEVWPNVPHWTYLHDMDLHKDKHPIAEDYDVSKRESLQTLLDQGLLDDTVLFYWSDHGHHMGPWLTSDTGAAEFKQPVLYVVVSQDVLDRIPGMEAALEANTQALVSPLDIYHTIRHFAMGYLEYKQSPGWSQPSIVYKGHSLGDHLAPNRTCEDAGVPIEECICGTPQYVTVPNTPEWDQMMQVLVSYVLDMINSDKNLIVPGVCRKWVPNSWTARYRSISSNEIGYAMYELVFDLETERTEPVSTLVELISTIPRSVDRIKEDGVTEIRSLRQQSVFGPWSKHCEAAVEAANGDIHACDCIDAPPEGWKALGKEIAASS